MKILRLMCLAAVLFPSVTWGYHYDVVYKDEGLVHVVIDLLSDISLLEAVSKEPLYQSITKEVCSSENCRARFWIVKGFSPKSSDLDQKQRAGMLAEYIIKEGKAVRIFHKMISHMDEKVVSASCIKEVFNKYCLGGDASTLPKPLSREKKEDIETLVYQENIMATVFRQKIAEISPSVSIFFICPP